MSSAVISGTLTKYQRQLVTELQQIYELFSLDFYDIGSYGKGVRTVHLELMRRAVARVAVVTAYTKVDEFLGCELAVHFFGKERDFPSLWKTKKFKLFNYHLLEEFSLMPKLRYVKALRQIPRGISADIERLNALRNGMAHAFFPENLKRSRPEWKGASIFSLAGLVSFKQDSDGLIVYLSKPWGQPLSAQKRSSHPKPAANRELIVPSSSSREPDGA
jgi:hypothetical protein